MLRPRLRFCSRRGLCEVASPPLEDNWRKLRRGKEGGAYLDQLFFQRDFFVLFGNIH